MKHNPLLDSINLPPSELPRVVVIGGGFAGINVVKKLKNREVQVVLLDRNNFHQFQPLLYQVATSGIEPDSIAFPLRKLFDGQSNIAFRMAEVLSIDAEANCIHTDAGMMRYDYLVIATGSDTNFFGKKEVQDKSIGMKSVQEALNIRSMILEQLEHAVITNDPEERDTATNFVIVGGGPAGVEMAGAIAEFRKFILPRDYPDLDPEIMSIYLVEAADRLLLSMSEKASARTKKYLKQMGVEVMLNAPVDHYDGETVFISDGPELKASTVIWTAGVKGIYPEGLHENLKEKGNRIKVDRYSRVAGYANIYAIGDVASMSTEDYPSGHPMVAQAAIQQGKLLAANLLNTIKSKEEAPFTYKDKGSLATVGRRKAVADLGKLRFGGYFAWLLWSFVHLVSISGFRNKLFVGLNWVWSYFTYDKGDRLIIRKYNGRKKVSEADEIQ